MTGYQHVDIFTNLEWTCTGVDIRVFMSRGFVHVASHAMFTDIFPHFIDINDLKRF